MSRQISFTVRPILPILMAIIALNACEIDGAESRLFVGPDEGPAARKIQAALDEPTTVELIETPISDVAEYVQELHGIPIHFDTKALEAAGVDQDAPVSMNLKGVSLRSVLRLMLKPLGLTYTIRHEVLLITTPAAAATHDYVGVYRVDDLLDADQTTDGLATLALCEAFGMTRDRALVPPAQGALDFIVHAQDPEGGGWRYQPRQTGDTSVTGWQVMAIHAGRRADLHVPDETLAAADRFLDSVQADGGSGYGYTTPSIRETTSAIGLLCRMYLTWDSQHDALTTGVKRVADRHANGANHYGRFFANQLLFQYTGGAGELWESWNEPLRENLIQTQAREGHAAGSWHREGDHGASRGGRLYCTALALLCLEVYYR